MAGKGGRGREPPCFAFPQGPAPQEKSSTALEGSHIICLQVIFFWGGGGGGNRNLLHSHSRYCT